MSDTYYPYCENRNPISHSRSSAVVNDEAEQRLYNLLKDFSEHGRSEFYDAHSNLYALASELWGRGVYYPFTYRVRGTIAWQKQKEEEK